MRTAAQIQQEKIDRDWNLQQQEALVPIYARYATIIKSIAADKGIVELVSRFFGVEPGTMLVTLADFELARSENPSEFRKAFGYVSEPVEDQRESVINQIAKLLSPESFRAGRGRLSGMSLEALRQRREQIKLKQQLQPYSAQDIREGLAEYRASQRPGEKVLPAEWTRERLTSRETSSYALKHLIRVYGASAVNNRLMGRG